MKTILGSALIAAGLLAAPARAGDAFLEEKGSTTARMPKRAVRYSSSPTTLNRFRPTEP